MVNHALVLQENQSKGHFVLVNAKMTSYLTAMETALLVEATKLFLMELVLVQLDIHATHVESAPFHVELVNLYSRVLVQSALLTPSLTQLLMDAVALKASTWILMEFVKNYK